MVDLRDRTWDQYDDGVGQVLEPHQRLRVLQRSGSFGKEITADVAGR